MGKYDYERLIQNYGNPVYVILFTTIPSLIVVVLYRRADRSFTGL